MMTHPPFGPFPLPLGLAPMPPRPCPPPPPRHPDLWGDADGYTRKEIDEADARTLAAAKTYADEKYVLPQDGIPASDLSSGVQASLAKADTALQEHQDISTKADLVNGKVPLSQLPEGTGQVQTDWNQTDTTAVDYIKNKPTSMTPTAHTHALSDVSGLANELAGKASAADVSAIQGVIPATASSTNKLATAADIPAAQVQANWNETNTSSKAFIQNKPIIPDVSGKADSASLAPAFSSSSTYAVGDYVTREGLLYKCTTAVTTAGAWNAANWAAVTVTDEMGGGKPLPFDAECEYVTVPEGACINTEITARGAILQWEATIRMPSTFDTTGSFRFGVWSGSATDSTMIWMSSGPRRLDMILAGDRYVSDWSAITGRFGKIGYDGKNVFCGESTAGGPSVAAGSGAGAAGTNLPFTLFGLNGGPMSGELGGDISSAKFLFCNSPVRDFQPVRVGTVGYLYDKVSGRLFGSAVGSIPLVPGPDKAQPTITTPGRIVELTASPAFTGTPTAPTAPAGTNTTQVATTEFVMAAIAALRTELTGNS